MQPETQRVLSSQGSKRLAIESEAAVMSPQQQYSQHSVPKTPVGITQISASAAREGQNNLFSSSERNKESALFLTESQHNNNDFIGAIAPIKPYKRLTREQIASLYKRPSPPPEVKNFALSELRQTEANSSVPQSLMRI